MGKFLSFALIFIISLAVTLESCSSTGCIDNQSSIPLAGFYNSENNSIEIDSITIGGVGAPNDTLILDNTRAKQVYLPFRSQYNSTAFYIHYDQVAISSPLLNDTITFNYNPIPYFVSEECGAMYQYTIKNVSYTQHLIDSVVVTDSMITNVDIERIKIYFRTTQE